MMIAMPTLAVDVQKNYLKKAKTSSMKTMRNGGAATLPLPTSFQVWGKNVTSKTVGNYRARSGFKPFHVIPKPMKTALNIEDRLWFCDFLRNWGTDDFLHLAPSDEFFIWTVWRPNYQNDRVWSLCIEEIADDEHYQEISKKRDCIGVFICFTAK